MSTLASMSVCRIPIFVWFKRILPFSPEMYDCPDATYSFLNESQAQIAHHCLEPELPGERRGGRAEGEGEREEN